MNVERCKATLMVGETTITFEGPADFVESQVARYTVSARKSDASGSPSSPEKGSASSGLTERDLITQKQPRGHHEITAVLAFGLAAAGMEEFTEGDMRKAYVRASVRPPKSVGQALRDAKNNFDYFETGSKRGTYRLTTHGDRTVRFDMPRGGSNA
jgi:hypothetical protein